MAKQELEHHQLWAWWNLSIPIQKEAIWMNFSNKTPNQERQYYQPINHRKFQLSPFQNWAPIYQLIIIGTHIHSEVKITELNKNTFKNHHVTSWWNHNPRTFKNTYWCWIIKIYICKFLNKLKSTNKVSQVKYQ